MRLNDKTLARNYLKHMKQLVQEYELIKAKKHPQYQFVSQFYTVNKIPKQNFIKYYNRFKDLSSNSSLLPQKRGRKFGSMKFQPYIQNKIVELRNQGFGRYEIFDLMLPKYGKFTPSASTIYNILKRKNLHKLNTSLIKKTRRIVKEKAGELGHFDCHTLPLGTIMGLKEKNHLLALVDDFTRITWVVVIKDLKALTVSMNGLKLFSVFHQTYGINFLEVITDNGSEFGRKDTKEENKENHPFERLLMEKQIKHRNTKPYRPQTNGKVERFWRTIQEEFLKEHVFSSEQELQEELFQYLITYNHIRRHQGINNLTPYQKLDSVTE